MFRLGAYGVGRVTNGNLRHEPERRWVMELVVDRFVRVTRSAGSAPVLLLFPDTETSTMGTSPTYADFAPDCDVRVLLAEIPYHVEVM